MVSCFRDEKIKKGKCDFLFRLFSHNYENSAFIAHNSDAIFFSESWDLKSELSDIKSELWDLKSELSDKKSELWDL